MLKPQSLFCGQYEICRRIGSGGMGAVYEVIDQKTKRHMALKVMLPGFLDDADARERFGLETVILAEVESEHIVPVTDAGVDEDTDCPYFVMELLRGTDLAFVLKEGAMAEERALEILEQLGRALEKTHQRQIVHRDIKPENLFLVHLSDGTEQLKVLDFGIARFARTPGARTTLCLGTPYYMAPEQISGDRNLDERADLYSLAQVAFTTLVGRSYLDLVCGERAPHHELMMRAIAGPIIAPSTLAKKVGVQLPQRFDAWFRRAAHRDPKQRFTSAREQVKALVDVFQEKPARFPILSRFVEKTRMVVTPVSAWRLYAGSQSGTRGPWSRAVGRVGGGLALSAALLLAAVVENRPEPLVDFPPLAQDAGGDLGQLVDSVVEHPDAGRELLPPEPHTPGGGTLAPQEEAQARRNSQSPVYTTTTFAELPALRGSGLEDGTRLEDGAIPDCSIPYVIDSRGIKQFRQECLDQEARKACEMPYALDDSGVKRFRPECVGFAR